MRVGFAGTPAFAATALAAIVDAGFVVPLVLTQPDRRAGRGMQLQASAVKQLAAAQGILVAQPQGLKLDGRFGADAEAAYLALTSADLDVLVVAAYGLILPPWVLAAPRQGCLNIHGSLLPRWRGAAPIQRAIEAGDPQTGITIMQMDAGLDTGPMLSSAAEPILADDTAHSLHDRLATLGARLLVDTLQRLREQPPTPVPQPLDGVTYAHKIEKAESIIDWSATAPQLERRLRAFDPFPGMSFSLAGETVKVWRARPVPGGVAGVPGEVLRADGDALWVACGDGALALRQLQRPGGRRIDASVFLRSCVLRAGTSLASSS